MNEGIDALNWDTQDTTSETQTQEQIEFEKILNNMQEFCNENILDVKFDEYLYVFNESKFRNNAVCVDIIIDGAVLKLYTEEKDKESLINSYATMYNKKVKWISTKHPMEIDTDITTTLPSVGYHAQSYNINVIRDFLYYMNTIKSLPMRAKVDFLITKSYYPNILAFGKEKIGAKIPIHSSVQEGSMWNYSYLIDCNGVLVRQTLLDLQTVYPEVITDEFIEGMTETYEKFKELPSVMFSLSYLSFIRKAYKRIDTIVKALINVARFSELHTGYRSEFYGIFQEARIQDVESDEYNLCDQIKYKGVFETETFKKYLGLEEINGVTYCPGLEALNRAAIEPNKRKEMLEEVKDNQELLPVYLYLYHMGNADDPDINLMKDYDKYEKLRQQLLMYIWLNNLTILTHEKEFEQYVRMCINSTSKTPIVKCRPKTLLWTVQGIPESIKISTYKRRVKKGENSNGAESN